MIKKCFLFHLKSSFRSEDIKIFIVAFWSCRKNGLITKIRLISKARRHNLVKKNCNMYIAQYLTKQKQPDNEILLNEIN